MLNGMLFSTWAATRSRAISSAVQCPRMSSNEPGCGAAKRPGYLPLLLRVQRIRNRDFQSHDSPAGAASADPNHPGDGLSRGRTCAGPVLELELPTPGHSVLFGLNSRRTGQYLSWKDLIR